MRSASRDARVVGMDLPTNPVKSLYFEEGVFAVSVREIVRGLRTTRGA